MAWCAFIRECVSIGENLVFRPSVSKSKHESVYLHFQFNPIQPGGRGGETPPTLDLIVNNDFIITRIDLKFC